MKKDNANILITSRQYKIQAGLLALLLTSLASPPLVADEIGLCKLPSASAINKNTFSADGKVHLQSDKVEMSENNISRFQGNVVIQQQNSRIETDMAEYKKPTEEVKADGNVRFITPEIQVKSKTANFNLKSEHAILEQSEYQSLTNRARGNAAKIEMKDAKIVELSDATYTTCDPNNADWLLSASSIKLNNKTHQGHASHVVLRFKGVPFFYFPYFRFPLGEQRLSGLLPPDFGHSDQHGDEVKIPYYWNIHPQLDATITPHSMSKRGTLLNSEFRYLTENNNGTLTTEFLNNDKIFNADRELLYWKHQSTAALGWRANAEYNYVADNNHFIDFSNDLNNTSTSYLTRTGNISYNSPDWLLNIKAENHQILSGINPYQRLPQITFNSRDSIKHNELNYSFRTEAVRFAHIDNKVIGERLHIKPIISYPMRSSSGFVEPKLSIQHTNYNLQQTTGETKFSRTLATFSLNSGLFFERDSQFFKTDYIQTLEPQLFYAYTPYKDQSALPVFDTSAYAFNINQPFTDYRFNGIDRIGDDNRLTTALATRFISQHDGQEVFMARVGQIYYFSDRKVQLPAVAVDTGSRSHLIAEIKTQFSMSGKWKLSSQLEWDPELKVNASSSNQLGYKYKKFNLHLAHRYQRDALETHEMKMNWELNSRWKVHNTYLYDVRGNHIVESLYGVDYESCCWGLRLSKKERYLSNTQVDRGIYLELVLKGLGGFGIQQ